MSTITDLSQLDLDGTYSYADNLNWQFQERVELLRGKILPMTPAPSVRHQRILGKMHLQMGNHLFENSCQLFLAPFDVRLYNRKSRGKRVRKSLLWCSRIYA